MHYYTRIMRQLCAMQPFSCTCFATFDILLCRIARKSCGVCMFRTFSVVAFVTAFFQNAQALTDPPQTTSPPPAISAARQKFADNEAWRSPSSLSSDFPRLGSDDCQRYGNDYGYAECTGPRRKPKPSSHPPVIPQPVKADRLTEKQTRTLNQALPKRPQPPAQLAAIANLPPRRESRKSVAPIAPSVKFDDTALKETAGQVLIVGFEGKHLTDPDVARVIGSLRSGRIAGVIIRSANIENHAQLRDLITGLRDANPAEKPIVAIEQPGGPGVALSEEKGFNFYASANLIASERNPYDAQLVYQDMANELAGLGVNLNIGPSADVCGDKSAVLSASCFGGTPNQVAAFATAFNFAHHDRGILTALHHMPFHQGFETSAIRDQASIAILREVTKRQPSDAIVVQVGAPSDAMRGAFSEEARKRLGGGGFNGAVIADLDAANAGAPVRYDEAIVKALQGGADMIVIRDVRAVSRNAEDLPFQAVNAALQSGQLDKTRMEEAARGVRVLKGRLEAMKSALRGVDTAGGRGGRVSSNRPR